MERKTLLFFEDEATEDLEVEQSDERTAYLNGTLKEEVHMYQPNGLEEPGKADHVGRQKRCLYGMKQAGREWNNRLSADSLEKGSSSSMEMTSLPFKEFAEEAGREVQMPKVGYDTGQSYVEQVT
mmetsp:Transcript_1351/g.4012  ORF Transcript_1351/g.4012 Transcript_1351/m.4012 type:complete len:125 (-) Transcript_1351:64-438(-)